MHFSKKVYRKLATIKPLFKTSSKLAGTKVLASSMLVCQTSCDYMNIYSSCWKKGQLFVIFHIGLGPLVCFINSQGVLTFSLVRKKHISVFFFPYRYSWSTWCCIVRKMWSIGGICLKPFVNSAPKGCKICCHLVLKQKLGKSG